MTASAAMMSVALLTHSAHSPKREIVACSLCVALVNVCQQVCIGSCCVPSSSYSSSTFSRGNIFCVPCPSSFVCPLFESRLLAKLWVNICAQHFANVPSVVGVVVVVDVVDEVVVAVGLALACSLPFP